MKGRNILFLVFFVLNSTDIFVCVCVGACVCAYVCVCVGGGEWFHWMIQLPLHMQSFFRNWQKLINPSCSKYTYYIFMCSLSQWKYITCKPVKANKGSILTFSHFKWSGVAQQTQKSDENFPHPPLWGRYQ